ncbi:MAG: TonB-dependent receptor [Paludibacter sp.]|jgi:TonB-linked SusC/RagA family outer membrane protein|nr:TonB-dependent receptor [Paludibacter sp.]
MKNTIPKILLLFTAFVFVISISAQSKQTIQGTVVDTNNEPIIGATVRSSSNEGTISDINGNFTLSATVNSTLTVSFIGYLPYQEKVISSKSNYRIVIQEDTKRLDEVVVVGYGTQRRSDLTGAISSVNTGDIKDFSSKSLAESLSGLAAGVSVTKGEGSPGSSADIIIRGAGSLNGMSPLYVVDGVAQDAGFSFNMRDVENIEILKDAGSAAIYGSRAAGGVVLIITKHGKKDEKATINANARYGLRNITSNIQLLNTADWIRARDAFGIGNTLDVLGATNVSDLPNTDWMKVMFDTGIEQEYNLSLASASDKTSFYLSGSYLGEKGVYMDTRADRFSIRNNLDYKFSKHISIGESLYGSTTTSNPATNSSIYNHTIPFRTVPVAEVYDADHNFAKTPSSVGSGPNFAGLEHAFHSFNDNNYSLTGQVYLNIDLVKGLNWRTTGSGSFYGFSKNTFTEYKNFGPVTVGVDGGSLNAYAGTSQTLMFNSVLTYEKTFGKHNFKAMVGTEWWKTDGYNLSVTAYNFAIPLAESIALASSGATKDASDGLPQERRASYFGRLNYDYLGRYLLAANFRADASDRFVGKNRWGFFPSVNVGWRLSDEEFIKQYTEKWLDNAKIRASWGILGNDMSVPQFMYQSTYSLSGISYAFDNSAIGKTGAWIATVGNENLKWEEVNQIDFGIDLTFLSNRLTVTYDYYNRQTRDMLYRGSLPLSGGMSYYFSSADPAGTVPVYFNAGLVENQGHEITIGWQDKIHDFKYNIRANASFNSNLVKQVGDKPGASIIDSGLDTAFPLLARTQDGYPMAMYYGYEVIGIFKTQAQVDQYNQRSLDAWKLHNPNHSFGYDAAGQPLNIEGKPLGIYYQKENTGVGDLIFDDNGQGYVTPVSRKFIGNPWPKMTLGINLNFEYKNFDLSAVFQGAFDFEIMNLVKPYTQMFSSDNTTAAIFNTSCFGKDNFTVTEHPRVGYINSKGSFIGDGAANRNYSTVSGYLIESGNYLKLKNLSIGYSLPKEVAAKVLLQNARIYVTAQNVFTLTKYSGIDPEIGGDVLMRGVDNQNRYLPSRLISFGVDLTF